MSTRGTLRFVEDGVQLAKIYVHHDSYPSGWPAEVKEFVRNTLVSNVGGNAKFGKVAKGFDDLALQIIIFLKSNPGKPNPDWRWEDISSDKPRYLEPDEGAVYPRVGDVYLTTPKDVQEYNYTLEIADGKIIMYGNYEHYDIEEEFNTFEEIEDFKEELK